MYCGVLKAFLQGGASIIRATIPDQQSLRRASKTTLSRMSCAVSPSRSKGSKQSTPAYLQTRPKRACLRLDAMVIPMSLPGRALVPVQDPGMHWEKSATQQCSCASPVPAIRTDCTHSAAIFFLSNQPSKHALLKHMDRDRLQDVLTEARVPEGLQDLVLARGFDCPSDFAFAFPTIAELQPFIVSARDFWTANNIEDPESSVAAARLRKALAECHRLSLRSNRPPIPGRHAFSPIK